MPGIVPRYRTAKTQYPVRIHSAIPPGGGPAPFSPDMLRQAAENWQRFQAKQNPAFPTPQATYIPPADVSIGHDSDQLFAKALLNRTDLPSCGYPVKVWMDGADMFAELDGVPESVAAMCNSGQFHSVSAEIYPNYRTPDGKYHGPVLRRIALLGSTPPAQKGLGRIPPFVYSFAEPARGGRPAQQVALLFSENPFMDKAAALAALQAAGIDITPWQDAPDPLVVAFATWVQANGQTAGTGQMEPVAQFSEMINRQVAVGLTPVLAAVKTMNDRFGSILSKSEEQECLTFAEANKGKLYGFETDPKQATYIVGRLMKMTPDLRKQEMAAIEARPVVNKFSERIPAGTAGDVRPAGSAEGPVAPERVSQLLSMTGSGRAILARRNQRK